MRVTKSRSIVKAITWRAIATLITISLVYSVTGELKVSLGVGAVEVVSKILFYYFHERIWDRIPWGRIDHELSYD